MFGVQEVPVKFEISVVQVGKSLKVTVPVQIARHVGLKKGDRIDMWVDDGRVIIEKKR